MKAEPQWADYPHNKNYQISSDGRARSKERQVLGRWNSMRTIGAKEMSLQTTPQGYQFFVAYNNTLHKTVLMQRAVLETFIGPQPDGMEACHENGIRSDNRLENLRWDTRSANAHDKKQHGTMTWGEQHGNSKLTEEKIQEIRGDARFSKQIAKDHGVHFSTICRIKSHSTWQHVA